MAQRAQIAHPRILALSTLENLEALASFGAALGFRQLLLLGEQDGLPSSADAIANFVQTARIAGLDAWLELAIDSLPLEHPVVERMPECFAIRHALANGVVDPRRLAPPTGRALARFDPPSGAALARWWSDRAVEWAGLGVTGLLVRRPAAVPGAVWRNLIGSIRVAAPDAIFLADTVGMDRGVIPGLTGCGFDFTLSSLPWWDCRAPWLVEEHAALSALAPVVANLGGQNRQWPRSVADRVRRIRLAVATGAGMLMPAGFNRLPNGDTDDALTESILQANALFNANTTPMRLRALTGPGDPVTAILRGARADGPFPARALIALVNPDSLAVAQPDPHMLAGANLSPVSPREAWRALAPGEVRLISAERVKPVKSPRRDAALAAADARVAIEKITPSVDNGAFAVKRLVGDMVVVEADIFADGHEKLAAQILYRATDGKSWSRAPMEPVANDRWRGGFVLKRLGRHEFAVEAWIDIWGGFTRDFVRKRDAGLDLGQEIAEAKALIQSWAARADGRAARILNRALAGIAKGNVDAAEQILAADLAGAMAKADPRRFRTLGPVQPVEADREAAAFAAWYELFPRSQTDDPARPGTLADVVARLPDIQRMGFDVLYFPPIHPIGRKNRKGRNNSLIAGPDDPGSPYAIGAAEGGHDSIHPALGTLDDFRALIVAAHAHGLEIALDFAVQCSPDHPWLTNHPGWFAWRPDGSMKYAENPPKKYEDIVNVDFYASAAIPDLWLALRDVVSFWIAQGVRIFRVDNPHTKPLPFWEWLIADIRAVNPEIIFLAEAFTRPKLMYRLAKLGFTQSYTYFTWRNTKAELTEYLTELNGPEAREFFRPHFFVNTPDINPYFLQTSGRAGFLIRAALAATLSGLWGIYSGFELCEFEPLPGREEYKDSEKYEIRPRDWSRPGAITAEIAALNRIRKAEPALRTHLGLTFYNAFNDRIIYFGKSVPGQMDKILVAISLDPHGSQEADFEVPLWEWALPDQGRADVTDLIDGARFIWNGKMQHVRLTPEAPYAIWRARPAMES